MIFHFKIRYGVLLAKSERVTLKVKVRGLEQLDATPCGWAPSSLPRSLLLPIVYLTQSSIYFICLAPACIWLWDRWQCPVYLRGKGESKGKRKPPSFKRNCFLCRPALNSMFPRRRLFKTMEGPDAPVHPSRQSAPSGHPHTQPQSSRAEPGSASCGEPGSAQSAALAPPMLPYDWLSYQARPAALG